MEAKEYERRRAERLALVAKAKEEQLAIDLERLDSLETEHGAERLFRIDSEAWGPGSGPTMAVFRVPRMSEAVFRRFESIVHRSKDGDPKRVDAQESLARACLLYPHPTNEPDSFVAACEQMSGLLSHAALIIVRRAQGRMHEEGKE